MSEQPEDSKARAQAFLSSLPEPPADMWSFFDRPNECPDRATHRAPQGPNEDLAQCSKCLALTWSKRPQGEQIGLHADNCSLPLRHEGYCQGGGQGHRPVATVRGYWPGMDEDIRAAHARFGGDAS